MANSSGSRSSQNGASQVKNSVRRKSKKSRKRKIIKKNNTYNIAYCAGRSRYICRTKAG